LRVIGTERHESRRVDNQLRGRSGRQGDPGASRFFLSLDDDLMRIFGGDTIKNIMEKLSVPDDEPIVHKWVTKAIETAQKRVESRNFEIRKNLLEYDNVMNQQRQTIYGLRHRVLEGSEIHEMVLNAVEQVAYMILDRYCPEGTNPEEWDWEGLGKEIRSSLRVKLDMDSIAAEAEGSDVRLVKALQDAYEAKEKGINERLLEMRLPRPADEDMEGFDQEAWEADRARVMEGVVQSWRAYEAERYLRAIDSLWKNHLYAMDHLKEGVYLEAYAQKDPKIIYKKEGYELFKNLLDLINESVVQTLFRVEVQGDLDMERVHNLRRQVAMHYGRGTMPEASGAPGGQGADESGAGGDEPQTQVVRTGAKVGRNDPCPCGSGKKYKKCCLPKQQAAGG